MHACNRIGRRDRASCALVQKNPVLRRRLDGMMTGYFEARAPKVVCLDLGTTGPNPVEDEIVAIAIVDWAGNAVHEGEIQAKSHGVVAVGI